MSKKTFVGKEMSVGKGFNLGTDSQSVKKYRSGKIFANRTFSDRQGRSAIPFPD
jgi:hypothetical protein